MSWLPLYIDNNIKLTLADLSTYLGTLEITIRDLQCRLPKNQSSCVPFCHNRFSKANVSTDIKVGIALFYCPAIIKDMPTVRIAFKITKHIRNQRTTENRSFFFSVCMYILTALVNRYVRIYNRIIKTA